jgi:hypothetical protein
MILGQLKRAALRECSLILDHMICTTPGPLDAKHDVPESRCSRLRLMKYR